MAHRKWKETNQQTSMLPGPAVPGCNLVSFNFLWAILCPQAVFDTPCITLTLYIKVTGALKREWELSLLGRETINRGWLDWVLTRRGNREWELRWESIFFRYQVPEQRPQHFFYFRQNRRVCEWQPKFCFDVGLQHAVNKFKCIDCSLTDIKSLEHRSSIFRYFFFPVSGSLHFLSCLRRWAQW